jgi:hypothetical protein
MGCNWMAMIARLLEPNHFQTKNRQGTSWSLAGQDAGHSEGRIYRRDDVPSSWSLERSRDGIEWKSVAPTEKIEGQGLIFTKKWDISFPFRKIEGKSVIDPKSSTDDTLKKSS